MNKYIKLLRPSHWVKNLFVFLPIFFSGKLFDEKLLFQSCMAFLLFSGVASIVYIFNDYIDIEADKNHPEKCKRPLASGAISKTGALLLAMLLLSFIIIALIFININLHITSLNFSYALGGYFLLNILYSIKLKHVAIVDICIISIGFVLRVFAGGFVTGIPVSQWAILLTFILALVLAVGKRRGELINAQISGKTRKSLDGYNVQFADISLSICCALAIVCYLMFTLSSEVQARFHSSVFYTVIFVVFAFLRYLQQTLVYNRTESPTKIIYKDRYIQLTLVLWLITFLLQIYF